MEMRSGGSGACSKSAEFKVVVLGDKGVGKTSLVLRFTEGVWHPRQQSTIGAFFLSKTMTTSDGTVCKCQIWDTAGQERFRAVAPMYYRNAAAAIICFDITSEASFNKMKDWVEELKTMLEEGRILVAISCNKTDLEEARVVSRARVEEFSRTVGAILCETSAKENRGVAELFQQVSEKVMATQGPALMKRSSEQGAYGLERGASNSAFGLSPAAIAAGFTERRKPPTTSSSCCS